VDTNESPIRWPAAHSGLAGLVRLEVDPDAPVRITGLGGAAGGTGGTPLVRAAAFGTDASREPYDLGARLRPVAGDAVQTGTDGSLRIIQHDDESGIRVTTRLQVSGGSIRAVAEATNDGTAAVRVGALSSLRVFIQRPEPGRELRPYRVYTADNTWCEEFRWQEFTLAQVGIVDGGHGITSSQHQTRVSRVETGSRSTEQYLPMGAVANADTGEAWAWQVESNAAWHWDLGDSGPGFVLDLGGPDHDRGEWEVVLAPGESFRTLPVAVAFSATGLDHAFGLLTGHRRAIRRPNADNDRLPVIFNDYMNCLNGDPTTEKLLPLIDAAAAVGSEYFVIDAGWYSDDAGWWDTVGAWEASTTRFPGGLGEVIDRIRERGMVPGLWVEPEVMGIESPAVKELPAEAYFQRDGEPQALNGRYQLDFRHPAVVSRMDAVVDRLIADFGVGYFKFDYNITAEHGNEVGGSSSGAALLDHNRAYSAWLDGIFARHPDLVIENCSSGGTRADYSQLSRMSLLSTSDQQDPVRYATIAAAAPTAVTPEQGAVWAYPQPEYDAELNALTLVNAMLGRVHLSGRIDRMDAEQLADVRTALATYKGIRASIARSVPRWPLGLPGWYDDWTALALVDGDHTLLSVWRRGGAERVELPLPWLSGGETSVGVAFPQTLTTEFEWDAETGILAVELPAAPAARLIRVGRVTG
jgi:alpha-galactosidase